ncbi:glycosyltransferase family 4 protein [Actinomycetaceae bacterium Sa1BUA1]|uniref:D-inositol 3-phosphate glycosyltransferase n=2 Tax=Oceanitalea stevensii TaxID=2763072 RepID=A0ABR8Z5K9_9MICO|nr:glycosyltransferase family 4 protein [Oceanitalea stevensii]
MVRAMRIVQLTSTSAGGVARHARQVAGLLADAGEEVLLAGPADVVAESPVPVAVVDIADRPRPSDVAALKRLRGVLAGTDLVHAHGLRAGAAAVLATRAMRGRPAVVVTLHNLPVGGPRVQAVAAVLERVVARGADLVLGVSGDLVARATRLGASAQRALVPAPARTETGPLDDAARQQLRASLGLTPQERFVLTVGRLAPQKGLGLLADTAATLVRSGAPAFRWVVVGDGPLAGELAERVRAESLPVVVAGRRDDVTALNAIADVVVSTSTWEGQPLAVQEALQAGAAVVATDVGGTREVTADAAVLVPPQAEQLAAAVARLLTDDAERARLRSAARERASRLPTPEDVVAQLRDVYARAVVPQRTRGTDRTRPTD